MGGFANNAPIVTDGLVFYVDAGNSKSYPGSGTTWTDLMGSKQASLINGPTYDSGNAGSIVFDGSDDYITVSQSSGDFSQNPMTTEHWVKFDQFNSGGDMLLMDRNTFNGSNGIETFILGSPKVVSVRGSGGTRHDGSEVISTGVWTHICIVFSGATAYIYINGELDNSGTIGSVQNSTHALHMGNYPSLPQYNFDGNWATLAIYHKALSASEVLQNYNALKNRFV
jgi:hypothetical protein